MSDKMVGKKYDIEQITRLLLNMRDNCVITRDEQGYNDPKRMEKYEALSDAIDLINNPSLLVSDGVRLGKCQCANVAEFIEIHLLDAIRNDPDIDNVGWVEDMIGAMRKLEEAGRT